MKPRTAVGALVLAGALIGVASFLRRSGGEALPQNSPASLLRAGDGLIAISGGVGATSHLFVMDPDRTGLRRITGGPAQDRGPAWSPDGKRIAFTRLSRGQGSAIFVIHPDGSGLSQLTRGIDASEPAWSPASRAIAFVVFGRDEASLYVMDEDGSGRRRLTWGGFDQDPAWSPDGRFILFSRFGRIYRIRPDGTGQLALTGRADDQGPAWSPNGRSIAFCRREADGTTSDIYVMRADGTGARRLTDDPADDCAPEWAPDGREVAFSSDRLRTSQVYEVNPGGTGLARLTDGPEGYGDPSWQRIPLRPGQAPAPLPVLSPFATPPVPFENALGPACDVSKLGGDFDGDGRLDIAISYGPAKTCPPARPGRSFRLSVFPATGGRSDIVLAECDGSGNCRAETALDFDGDGKSELLVETGGGAAYAPLRVYALTPSGLLPVRVASPGNPIGGFAPGPILLQFVSDSAAADGFGCRARANGSREVIAQRARKAAGSPVWRVHRTTLVFDGRAFRVLSVTESTTRTRPTPPFGGRCDF